jgi:hypothetical protein
MHNTRIDIFDWHKWFAWYPVEVFDPRYPSARIVAWLEPVRRKRAKGQWYYEVLLTEQQRRAW